MKFWSGCSLSLAIVLILTACGGGGGSSSGEGSTGVGDGGSPSDPETESIVVAGSAIKGVMKSALVTVYELDDSGNRVESVGTGETGLNGQYEILLSEGFDGGALEVEVSVQDTTLMVCDAVSCGEGISQGQDVSLPSDFTLNSLTAIEANSNRVEPQVTIWSSMAASRARSLINENESLLASIRQANAEVGQFVGFDIARTDIKSLGQIDGASSNEARSAIMNAAAADILFNSGVSDSVSGNKNQFAAILDDGVAGDTADPIKLPEISERVEAAIDASQGLESDAKDALNTLVSQYEAAGDGGFETNFDPELDLDEGSSQAEKIASFQTFVANTRAWVRSIEEVAEGESLSQELGVDVNTVEATLGQESLVPLGLALEVAVQSLQSILSDPARVQDAIDTNSEVVVDVTDGGSDVGSMILTFSDDDGLSIGLVGEVVENATTDFLPFSLTLNTNLPADSLSLDPLTISNLLVNSSIVLDGSVSNSNGVQLLVVDGVDFTLDLNSTINLNLDQGLPIEDFNSQFSSAELNGSVAINAPTGERFEGLAEIRVVRLENNRFETLNEVVASLEKLKVVGEFFSINDSSFNASAKLNVNNAASFDTFAFGQFSENEYSFEEALSQPNSVAIFNELGGDPEAIGGSFNVILFDSHFTESPQFNLGEYVADGTEKVHFSSFSLIDNENQEFVDAFENGILQSLPSILTFEYEDPQTGEPKNLDVDLNSALIASSLEARIDESGADVSLELDEGFLDSAVEFAHTDFGVEGFSAAISTSDGVQRLEVSVTGADRIAVIEASLESVPAPYALEGVSVQSVFLNETFEFGEVEFSRPAEERFFEACVCIFRLIVTTHSV